MIKLSYFDGHYPNTNRTLEEIEKSIQEEEKKSSELTDWPKID